TGSPYQDVVWNGQKHRIGQANNVFIFPGLGLGAIVAGATRVTDAMISAAAMALAEFLTDANIEEGVLMPRIGKLWEATGCVGLAVARQAIEDGVATKVTESELEAAFAEYRWFPDYPEFIKDE
ncbi:MAG TPA: malic enzyme-like NAD(P)-binding protein, partial [Woeseiaceae bacterium]